MAVPLSAPDEAIISHKVTLDDNLLASTSANSGKDLFHLYDIHKTSSKLLENGFKNVALQFPDELLIDSVPIFWAITDCIRDLARQRSDGKDGNEMKEVDLPKLYILADTSYGNCCVDEVAAQHVDADVVVHYGHACLSPTSRLPVIYVFTKSHLEVSNCITSLSPLLSESWLSLPPRLTASSESKGKKRDWDLETRPEAIVLMYDVAYAQASMEVKVKLEEWLKEKLGEEEKLEVILSRFDTETNFERHLERRRMEEEEEEGEDGVLENDAEELNKIPSQAENCCGKESSCRTESNSQCCSSNPTSSSTSCNPTCTSTSNPIPTTTSSCSTSSRIYDLPNGTSLESCGIVYLGGESLSLTNLLLSLGPTSRLISYNPLKDTSREETGSTNRLLMRRYTLVQKARDASVIALLVGTLGINSYLPLLINLRSLLTSKKSGRKVYTISVGKLNPAKLANFQEIDLFVLIACGENSLVDSKDFYKPIVTPFEMFLALDDSREWTGEYKLELDGLVNGLKSTDIEDEEEEQDQDLNQKHAQISKKNYDDEEEEFSSDEEPHFSLITGGLVSRSKYQPSNAQSNSIAIANGTQIENSLVKLENGTKNSLPMKGSNGEVILKSENGKEIQILQSASGRIGSRNGANGVGDREREWKGLKWENSDWTGEAPAVLKEGREGIAGGYGELEDEE